MWSLFILFIFIFRVPEFEKHPPCGAGYLIFGAVMISGLIFIISLLYVLFSNFYMKVKIHSDLIFVFIPIVILFLIFLFRL